MITRRFAAAGAAMLFVLSLVRPAAAGEAPATTTSRHSLWKVEGKTNAVYLLGSVHVLKPENYPLPPVIESAFSNSQVVVLEADIGKMMQPEMVNKLMTDSTLPEGQSLKDQVSPAVYASLTRHMADAELPLEMFEQMKPPLVAMMLEAMELVKLGFDPKYGLDQHFFDRAQSEGKTIVPLETVEFQIGLITSASKAEGEALLKSTLDDLDQIKKSSGEMIAAWQAGDSAKIEKILNDDMRESPAVFKRMVTDRNQRWVPTIEGLLRGGKNAIVIVGAGHLVGNEGVVESLKKKGLKVTQL